MRPLVAPRYERLRIGPYPRADVTTTRQFNPLWVEPKGIDSLRPLNKIEPGYAEDMVNLMFKDGQYQSRLGTRLIGNDAASTVVQATDLIRANGKKVTIRFCTRHIEIFNYASSMWRVFSLALHGNEDDLFTWTSWGDKLLFSNFVDGMWELDFQSYAITKVTGAPGAKHLTVFGNRVVATAVNAHSKFLPYRIQWSVKNNYLDWTGIGSGFEDLFGAPGGVVDEAMATIPMTDEAAFVIRATSTWQMSQSGVAIAPFRFSRLLRIGSPSRYSIVETPRGAVFLNNKSVYTVGVGSFNDIGKYAINRIKANFEECRDAYAIYDSTRDEYRLSNCNVVFRYRWDEGGWTKDLYEFRLRSLGIQIQGKTGYPIDSLLGTVDELDGTIDDLVIDRPDDDKVLLVPSDSFVTMREHESIGVDAQDQLADGSLVDASMEIISGIINLNNLEASETLEAHLEYETDESQAVVFEFKPNGGGSYTLISNKSFVATIRPEIQRLHLAEFSRSLQFRLRSETLGKLRILAFIPASVMVHRAS